MTNSLQLYIKRTKTFIQQTDSGERHVTVSVANKPQAVPAWVRSTRTYVLGVADGSIVDLTPLSATNAAAELTETVVEQPFDPAQAGVNLADPAVVERLKENAVAAAEAEAEAELEPAAAFGGSKGPARPKGLQGSGGRARP